MKTDSNQSSHSSVDPTITSGGFSGTYMKHLMSGDDGKGNKGILHLSMAPLSKEEMGTLMAGVIGASPPTRIVQHVLDRTKGNVG